MSEFTAGTLFLYEKAGGLLDAVNRAKPLYRVEKLNAKWGVILSADDFLSEPGTRSQLLDFSRLAPLLYFCNAEDHGWGYILMNQGQEMADVNVDYEVEADDEAFAEQFCNAKLAHFSLFNSNVGKLEEIFELEHLQGLDYIGDLVEQFKQIVGIEELSWVSFNTNFAERNGVH